MAGLEKLLLWTALVVYALTCALPGGGVVLCLEPDGHVTIESAAAGCGGCCPDEPGGSDEVKVGACPCVDVALTGIELPLAKNRASEPALPELEPAWRSSVALAATPAPSSAPDAGPRVLRSSPTELVRSTVLRV